MELTVTTHIAFGGPWKRAAIASERACLFLLTAAALVLVGGLATAVSGQQYQADPINEALAKQSEIIKGMAKDPTKYKQEQFDEYFTKYYFPAMTRFGGDDLAKLFKARNDLFMF